VTIASETNRVSFAGNGVTVNFAFNAPYRASTDFEVTLRLDSTGAETLQVLTTHYTINGVANANTGGFDSMTLTMLTAPPAGRTLVINRKVAPTSAFDPNAGAAVTAPNLEGIVDRLCLAVQNLQEQLNRSILLPKTSPLANKVLPDPAVNLGGYLKYNAAGNGVEATTQVNLSGTAVSAFVATLLDDANAGAFLTTLGISAFVQTLLDDANVAAFFATLGIKTGSAVVNFASVADNATSAGSVVAVVGAAVGDFVMLSASGNIMTTAGVFLFGNVTAAAQVSAYLHNDSDGAFDAASQTVYAVVFPKSIFGL